MRCSAYCISTTINTNKLLEYFRNSYRAKRYREAIHIKKESTYAETEGDIFFFSYGAVVSWGHTEEMENIILKEISPFLEKPLDIIEDDFFHYNYDIKAKMADDIITLPNNDILTKLAFSHGLAQSVKLGVFELTIQKTIDLTKKLPELLAKEGNIKLSRHDIRKMMGRLFIDRSSINLHQELLDTPEFFWEYSELEPYYNLVSYELDRDTRVSVLNKRLNVLHELFDMLGNEINHQHSSKLEWTIIWLIVIEVALSIARDFFH